MLYIDDFKILSALQQATTNNQKPIYVYYV